jgi:cellulose synthase/poly-beta-1,6-N-acetylglucosamine synthase-like glycosyltransferase/spore germination protein YaaH/peptidoglycan/xylan/chitin deacetylase (PgdA/CDA1 family)
MSDRAVFFDPSHRRWWWIKRVGTLMGLGSVTVISLWLISLFTVPLLPGVRGITIPIIRSLRRSAHFPRHQSRLQQFLLRQERRKLLAAMQKEQKVWRARAALPPIKGGPIVAAFYAPWQETGLWALRANADNMTHVLPAWLHLKAGGAAIDYRDWDPKTVPHNIDVLGTARQHNLNVIPVFSNAEIGLSGAGEFEPLRAHALLTNPAAQDHVIQELKRWCLANRFQGINVDFESLQDGDYALMPAFMQRMKAAFTPLLTVSADLESSRPQHWRELAAVCDFVVVMAYDEHGSSSQPGPIASMTWYRDTLRNSLRSIPREKLVMGIANYGYDWKEGEKWADPVTYQEALLNARKYRAGERPEDIIDFDATKLNPTFWYQDDDGVDHEVWFLDAVTAANQWTLAQGYGVRGCAVWVLGSTDPSLWTFLGRDRLGKPPDMAALRKVEYPMSIEFAGESGEIAVVESKPTKGSRALEVDPDTGLALDESYHRFPTPYVIRRTGYKEKMIALTIDDGPATPYTADMLDELKALNVPATFFLIGQNAERYPQLVRRIWNEGHEIGNHSFTHPNTGAIPPQRVELELNATQRVFQSILHRSTLLFRPPYNADAEPSSVEEVRPLEIASSMNYITVLEFIDPQDWREDEPLPNGDVRPRTAEDMLKTTLDQLKSEKGNCVLLHDGGGDRSETVRLIPLLVTELRKQGYRFVPVSTLIDSTRDVVNPSIKGADTLMLASDRLVFEAIYISELFLSFAFITAIILGTARMLFVAVFALINRWRERRETFDRTFRPPVTVVIAAFNEETVIARTIHAVLANRYDALDVIVVDDGSKDDTAGVVAREFGAHPSVRLLRQENGGKAAALNAGIAEATGEIIIALDADTIFKRDTIGMLVRRFADPAVGAVAGNVKVGNRLNPLTYWQSIEYVTSQNLDRRAYADINSVTVVPGAVGAWRRTAVIAGGGYTTDTMAEDMDLTWRIRLGGWKIETESAAIGYTEVPDSFRTLFKQRFRWAFGTLQCLWKHRKALGGYGWFGRVMLPSLWLFQIFFQALSPLIDLQIVWALGNYVHAYLRGELTGDWQPLPQATTSLLLIAFMYAFFFVVELIGSLIAFRLDRENPKVLVWLFWQRFLYRQLMYAVLIKSLKTAVSGMRAGWGKLDRKGTVSAIIETPEPASVSS